MRTCSDCCETKPLDAEHFQRIAGRNGYYGRCKVCRNRRKRERYHSSTEVQRAEIARSWRNKLKRTGRTLPRVQDIGIAGARVTAASRSGKSPTVHLEFRGVRDSPHIADKDTRIRL